MTTQQTLKQYGLVFPPLQPFSCCINPILNPILGMLNYAIVAYRMEDMKFGNEGMAFNGNCCTYHWALCGNQCYSCLSCGIWFNFYGGMHVMPTYLDQHISTKKDQANFVPGNRWQQAAACKLHFETVRSQVLDKGKPFEDHMYIMQNTPAPGCWESCVGLCVSAEEKAMLDINNQLRYVRIANRQLRFTGDAAGFKSIQPSCTYKTAMWPCYCTHYLMGTYKSAYNQYVDNHIEWLPTGHNEGGMERSLAEGSLAAVNSANEAMGAAQAMAMGSLASGMGGMFGSGSQVAPESNAAAPPATPGAPGEKSA